MSSMLRTSMIVLAVSQFLTASAPLAAEEAGEWDRARASLVASQPGPMAGAISQWEQLSGSARFSFGDYTGFILANPGFPDEEKLRGFAEARLASETVDNNRIVAFFDRYPPLSNVGRAHYALALNAVGRGEAQEHARTAWRGGQMSPTAEATLLAVYANSLTPEDHDARMDALLWQRDATGSARQISLTSQAMRPLFQARLFAVQGSDPQGFALPQGQQEALKDPGYTYNLVRQLRGAGRTQEAISILSSRPGFTSVPLDQTVWITELLTQARAGSARAAQRIAASVDDAFTPGTDISQLGFKLRDDYTSLMWLGGTKSLWELGDAASAAPLFYRYGAAARTTYTRSKGFYWAGLAASRAGDRDGARRYYEMAAQYPDRFYGMLAMEELGRPMPSFAGTPTAVPTEQQRADFQARPLTRAVREVARDAPWRVGIRFYREIAAQATTEAEMVLVADLAREIGRRDLAVILGEDASAKGFANFTRIGFPTITTPPATNWTMVHAVTRQESQFAQNAISHAGASGLMQLMPGTAREQAGKMGMSYLSASVINDASYNIRLGDGYFSRMMDYYGGSYLMAAGAYNAGPGNVNKWLRANGDPRNGGIEWVEWIERIPLSETRNYVQRVLENAVVYEAMNPEKASYGGPKTIRGFLR